MKRHVGAAVALLTALAVADSHLDWVVQDGAPLLSVSGRLVDVHGWAHEWLLRLRRDCSPVQALAMDSPQAQDMLAVIRQHSLPDSRSARGLQAWQLGTWGVADVAFDLLNPSLVALQLQQGQWRVQDQAVWSGATVPWHASALVRRYLRRQAPHMPETLIQCIAVDPLRYGPAPARAATGQTP